MVEEGELRKKIKEMFPIPSDSKRVELANLVRALKEELREILYPENPLDWIYHTGEKLKQLETFDKKWFGDADV